MQQTTFAPGALRVETGEGQECLDVVLDFESPGVPVVVVTNFENACTMPIGSGPWGIRTERDRFICSFLADISVSMLHRELTIRNWEISPVE
jgi:hypothetical protein